MNQLFEWLSANAAAISIVVATLPIVGAAVQFLYLRREQERRRRFQVYHRLLRQLVQRENPDTPKMLDRQIATIFELRSFQFYFPVTLRILRGLRNDWANYGPLDKRLRLLEEIDLAIEDIARRERFGGLAVASTVLWRGMKLVVLGALITATIAVGCHVFSNAISTPSGPAPVAASIATDLDSMQHKGLLGDYIGGVWGTAVGGLTLIAVLMTWRTSRKADYRSRTYQLFSDMLRSHEEIVSSVELNGATGRDVFATILSEFNFVYGLVLAASANRNWSLQDRIDIAYTFVFFGPRQQTRTILKKFDADGLKEVADGISRERAANERLVPPKIDRTFKGHQNRLSQYFRNLFVAYRFLDESGLGMEEKRNLGKALRAKLSNYEQALLVINCLSHLGRQWINAGLIKRYMPVKNVPEDFFAFDTEFVLKREFPDVQFEWEQLS